jgi:hypothetical protein
MVMFKTKQPSVADRMVAHGSPNGKIDAELNELYLDSKNCILWIKESPEPKRWKCLGQVVESA